MKVAKSVGGRRWIRRLPVDAPQVDAIAAATGCHGVVAQVLAGRGLDGNTAPDALQPTIRALMPDPDTLRDMDKAAQLLADAVESQAKVGLFGDYDVDGAASCALLGRWLRVMGAEPVIHIPDRLTEGYGPNIAAIDGLADQGIDLLVTLDCGATSHEALGHAVQRGLSVLVLDHHQMRDLGPGVNALVNPNRPDDTSGLGHLCAAGVTFMTLVAANRELRNRGIDPKSLPDLLEMLDLVALATVADVVPLVGLNRAFVVKGLQAAGMGRNVGLSALINASRLTGAVRAYHLGFVLGPRINAGGRIGNAAMGANLLISDDPAEADHLARELDTLNAQRQAIEAESVADAIAKVEASEPSAAIILRDDTWHQGVVGLIAARLKERFQKPALAFTLAQDGAWTGSARSVHGVDIGKIVHALVEEGLATKGGGHAMAAGLSLDDGQWAGLSKRLQDLVAQAEPDDDAARTLEIDSVLTATGASLDLTHALDQAGPYGTDFPEPIFALASHRVTHASVVGTGHVRVSLSDGQGPTLSAIAFRQADTEVGQALLSAKGTGPVHIAGTLSINSWQGRESVQMRIIDIATP